MYRNNVVVTMIMSLHHKNVTQISTINFWQTWQSYKLYTFLFCLIANNACVLNKNHHFICIFYLFESNLKWQRQILTILVTYYYVFHFSHQVMNFFSQIYFYKMFKIHVIINTAKKKLGEGGVIYIVNYLE